MLDTPVHSVIATDRFSDLRVIDLGLSRLTSRSQGNRAADLVEQRLRETGWRHRGLEFDSTGDPGRRRRAAAGIDGREDAHETVDDLSPALEPP